MGWVRIMEHILWGKIMGQTAGDLALPQRLIINNFKKNIILCEKYSGILLR